MSPTAKGLFLKKPPLGTATIHKDFYHDRLALESQNFPKSIYTYCKRFSNLVKSIQVQNNDLAL